MGLVAGLMGFFLLPEPGQGICLAHSSHCTPRLPEESAAELQLIPGATVPADLLDGDPSGWAAKAIALDDLTGDAKGSMQAFIKLVQAQPRSANRWSDLGKWNINHRPGGIRSRQRKQDQKRSGAAAVGSVAAAISALRVSAQVESLTRRRPVETVGAAVGLAEQAVQRNSNTPEPLLAAELLELAMEIEHASGETWEINSGGFTSTDRGGPFHGVALALWEHGYHERAEKIWREQVVRLRGISKKDCGRRECPYSGVESYMARRTVPIHRG